MLCNVAAVDQYVNYWRDWLQPCSNSAKSLPAKCQKTDKVEDSGLLGCDAVSLGEWLSTFRTAVVPSSCCTWLLFVVSVQRGIAPIKSKNSWRTGTTNSIYCSHRSFWPLKETRRLCVTNAGGVCWNLTQNGLEDDARKLTVGRCCHCTLRVGACPGRTVTWAVCRLFSGNALKQIKFVTEYTNNIKSAHIFRKSLNISLLSEIRRLNHSVCADGLGSSEVRCMMTLPEMLVQHCTALLGWGRSDVTAAAAVMCNVLTGRSSADSESADGWNEVWDETGRRSYDDNPWWEACQFGGQLRSHSQTNIIENYI